MLLSVLLLIAPPVTDIPWGGNDFVQYYVANELLLSGQNPYDRELAEAKQKAYGRGEGVATFAPPWSLMPALPLLGFSFQTALVVNVVINLILMLACAAAWAAMLFPDRPRLIPLMLLALPLWMPCLAVVGIGQLSLWPLAGFTGWLWLTRRGHDVPAAAVLVLTVVKPHLGLLPGIFVAARWLRRRQWLAMLTFVLALTAVTAITFWLRPTIWGDYADSLGGKMALRDVRSGSLDGWGRATFGQSFWIVSWGIWCCALAEAWHQGWRRAKEVQVLPLYATLLCVAAVATVPYAFSFDFVFLLPGFLLAVGRMLTNAPHWRWGMLAWLALEGWMVAGKLYGWEEMAYWFVPWLGLGLTAWLAVLHRRDGMS